MSDISSIFQEQATFTQFFRPGLESGTYTLNVQQKIFDGDTELTADEPLGNVYTLSVRSDRFFLAQPSKIVSARFPEDTESGEFQQTLPHVVFNERTFPWSRELRSDMINDPNPATWLAVLLLDDDDRDAYPDLVLDPRQGTIADLVPTPEGNLSGGISYDLTAQPLDSDVDPTTTKIQTLDIPLGLFWQLAPTVDDLRVLAHGRSVSLVAKPTIGGVTDKGEPLGDFSVVVGNRLPQVGKKSYAYLVSLEGMGNLLPTCDQGGMPSTYTGPTTFVRLAVLMSWTYSAVPGSPAEFDARVEALSVDSLNAPYAGSNVQVGAALRMGYVPLNQTMRSSYGTSPTIEATVSWYRGPLAPYSVMGGRFVDPISSADGATLFDPTTGMFDASYAAAWTIGRLIALQDRNFSIGLYTWKQNQAAQVARSVENELVAERFGALLTPRPRTGPTPQVAARALTASVPTEPAPEYLSPRSQFVRVLIQSR